MFKLIRNLVIIIFGAAVTLAVTLYLLSLGRHDGLTQMLTDAVRDATGAELVVEDAKLTYWSNFPFLSLELDGVSLHSPTFKQDKGELLRAELLSIQLRPLSLFRRRPRIRSIVISDGKFFLFRDREGTMNVLKSSPTDPTKKDPPDHDLFSIDLIKVRNFTFQYLDDLRRKDLHVHFADMRVGLAAGDRSTQAQVVGRWLFRGLTFKEPKGGYLVGKEVLVDLGLDILPDENRIVFQPSTLDIEGHPFRVDGQLRLTKPAYLELNLGTRDLVYRDLLPLLTPALRASLARYDYEGKLDGTFHLAGDLQPGIPTPINFRATSREGKLRMDDFRIDSLSFQAAFDSHCDTSLGPTQPIDCLHFSELHGRLQQRLPFASALTLKNLKDPRATVDIQLDAELERLDDLLPPSLVVQGGRLQANIHHDGKLTAYGPDQPRPDSIHLSGQVKIEGGRLRQANGKNALTDVYADIELRDNNLRIPYFNLRVNGDQFRLRGEVDHFLAALIAPDRAKVAARMRVASPRLDMEHFLGTGETTGKRRKRPRAKRSRWDGLASVVDQILSRGEASLDVYTDELVYGRFSAEEVGFSSQLRERCPGGSARCLELNRLRARIYGLIPLEADMTIRDPSNPQLDLQAQLRVETQDLNTMLAPEKMQFLGGRGAVRLTYQGAMNDFIDPQQYGLKARIEGGVELDSLVLLLHGEKYRVDSGQAKLEFNERDLVLSNLSGRVNDLPVEVGGHIGGLIPFVFLPDRDLEAAFNIHSPFLDFGALPFVTSPPNKATASVQDSVQRTTGFTKIVDSLLNHLQFTLGVAADSLRYGNFSAERVGFTSRYTTACSDTLARGEGCLRVDSFRAFVMEAIPVEADIQVFELHDPVFRAHGTIDLPLENLNELFPPEQLVFRQGHLRTSFRYRGQPQHNQARDKLLTDPETLVGSAVLEDAAFDYVAKGYRIDSAEVRLRLEANDLRIDDFHLRLNENPFRISGYIEDLVPFLVSKEGILDAHLQFYSPHFSFDHFSAPKKREHLTPSADYRPNRLKAILDTTLHRMRANISLRVDSVRYRNFRSTDVDGRVVMTADRVGLDTLDMKVAQGDFFLRGEIQGLEADQPEIDVYTRLDSVHVADIFQAFDNFGQEGLTYQNLEGTLNAEMDFRALANSNYDLLPASFQGSADLTLIDGALRDLPMFRNMNSFLFRGREMDNIRFSRLHNTFQLDGRHFHIDFFDIYSSAFSFGIEGRICFHDHEHTDMLVTVPLFNLYRRIHDTEVLDDRREDRSFGLSILLRVKNRQDDLKVFPVLSKKPFLDNN